jgi:transposase
MRIIEPSSKLESLELLKEFFNIEYQRRTLYRQLPSFVSLKSSIEEKIITFAKNNLNFDFSLVFYDVTTLYFESFKADELRKPGFSKDSKSNQPQVVIGLVVNKDGYPIKIEVFKGNTFEGHTMLPVIKKLQKDYSIDTLTVVADAAMLSFNNMQELEKAGLNYIVGARLGNISTELLKKISEKLNKNEGIYYKTETPRGILICDYSHKRAIKDKSDRNKQLLKAKFQIASPQSITRKSRFVKEVDKINLKLNEDLIIKDELREGIKGYYTNLKNIEDSLIVSRYKDL